MPTQVYEIYIKASAQAIWDAVTLPDWTSRYAYAGEAEYELRPGGKFKIFATLDMLAFGMPEVVVDGEVISAAAPNSLVQTYRFLFNDQHVAEGFTKVTWEIVETGAGFTRLTVTHVLDNAPIMAAMVSGKFSEMGGGGWTWILSDLKSLLETGSRM